ARASLHRALAHAPGLRARHAAVLLDVREVALVPEPALHRPARALDDHLLAELARLDIHAAVAGAGRHEAVELVDQRAHRFLVAGGRLDFAAKQTHATVYVVAAPARRDHAVLRRERRHAADREAVAPVDVRHRQRVAQDPGHVRDV